mmetsp:Transcript_33964/g.82395  ORF Transcript_33964/g.82395 Transcript_33964/m.82395 type:complete len:85 (+) Transcript_33964:242-496(+)
MRSLDEILNKSNHHHRYERHTYVVRFEPKIVTIDRFLKDLHSWIGQSQKQNGKAHEDTVLHWSLELLFPSTDFTRAEKMQNTCN